MAQRGHSRLEESVRASRYRSQRSRQIVDSLTPGLRPGLGRPLLSWNAIRVTLELLGDVANRPIEVALVECCGEESTTPLDAAGNAAICPHRSHALGQPYEVAQAGLRPEADYQVDVVC